MTDLVVSVAILVVWLAGSIAVWLRLRSLDRRHAKNAQLRIVRRYKAVVAPARESNVVELRRFSVKVPEKRAS